MARKYFGTDGIRGRVGEGAITPEFFLQFGWAVGQVLNRHREDDEPCKVLIGKDTRISGYMFESALQAGLISAGVDVVLLGPMPTPAVAYLTRTFQACAGFVISASHNPYHDNGIKLFNTEGVKLTDELELEIEAQLEQTMTMSKDLGKASRLSDANGRYIEFCKGTMPWGFSLHGLNIVLDCANGATYHLAPKVFAELGAHVTSIGVEPNGHNINLECGATKLNQLQKKVLEEDADLGIAFDGDGDRVMFVDHKGEIVDGDQLLYIIASFRKKYEGVCEGVVGTLMTNFGFEMGMKNLGIPFDRAKVGDRYVIESMKKNNWHIGGESSGHIVCSDVTTTGDGIISALQVMKALVTEKECLHDIKQNMQKLPQVMINVPVKNAIKLDENTSIKQAIDAAESQMEGKGRVLLRPSGTEPVIRVMVEGQHHDLVSRLAKELAEVVGKAVA
ncbi:phosphoglucosamine mutase [Agarilytica rhodophyticola]|uniref:phosphoglucosamine mutase n=1 Tax=Agarilytica rhodophyticola TaxID=1737490 RepID=UPI000B340F05|nr:phosphoglucosamine mutase [Agarilytica rhodophyticola]